MRVLKCQNGKNVGTVSQIIGFLFQYWIIFVLSKGNPCSHLKFKHVRQCGVQTYNVCMKNWNIYDFLINLRRLWRCLRALSKCLMITRYKWWVINWNTRWHSLLELNTHIVLSFLDSGSEFLSTLISSSDEIQFQN